MVTTRSQKRRMSVDQHVRTTIAAKRNKRSHTIDVKNKSTEIVFTSPKIVIPRIDSIHQYTLCADSPPREGVDDEIQLLASNSK